MALVGRVRSIALMSSRNEFAFTEIRLDTPAIYSRTK
jgi:hypothetical protein